MTDTKKILKISHLRITKTRLDVLSLFLSHNYALTHAEINNKLNNKYDNVTLYRTINSFEEKSIIHKIPDNSKKASYALNKDLLNGDCGDTHIHFHCKECGHNFCVDVEKYYKINLPDKFDVSSVNIIAEGLCEICKKQPGKEI